jgi:UDP-glucuronate decarboxylase
MKSTFRNLHPNLSNYLLDNFKSNQIEANICLIGDSGFVGKWIVFILQELEKLNIISIRVTGLSRRTLPTKELGANFQHLFVEDLPKLDLKNFTHLIWAASSTSRNQDYDSSNLLFDSLLSQVLHQKFEGYFINLSSGIVYEKSFTTYGSIDEDSPTHSLDKEFLSSYAINKLYIEDQLSKFANEADLKFINTRLFSFCGPGMPMASGYAMHDFFSRVINNQEIIIEGNPDTLRSYMHPFDLAVKLFELIIGQPRVKNLNIGSGDVHEISFFANQISKFGDLKIVSKSDHFSIEPQNYFPNTSFLHELTKTKPYFSTQSMLEDTYNYYLNKI